MKQRILSVLLVLTILLSVLPLGAAAADSGWDRIHVMETTDMHGHIAETQGRADDEITWNLAAIAQDVQEARENSTYADVLLLDGGDIYQGPPISNQLMGDPLKAAMEVMDYDAVVLGNHEFDWDVTTYAADSSGTMPPYSFGTYQGDSDIPVLACNLYDAGTDRRVNFTRDYTTVVKAGHKVAVIGWIPDYSRSIMASKIAPYFIDKDLGRFRDRVKEINAAEKPDITVVVTHNSPSYVAGKLDKDEVQLVCGGHSHKMSAGTARSGVAYIQGGAFAKGYAEADILVNKATGEVKVENLKKTELSGDLTDTGSNTNLDPAVLAISRAAWEEIRGSMEEVLGRADRIPQDRGNFITSVMLDVTAGLDTRIAFTNNGGIRDSFRSRDITAGDIYAICPFGNRLLTYELKGSQLAEAIREGECCSGARVTGGKVVFDDGTTADPDRTYRVCVNEFCATGRNSIYKDMTPVQPYEEAPIDNESMVASLRRIGKANNGRIPMDDEDHVIFSRPAGITYEEVPAKEPTWTEEGNIRYWKGSDGRNYVKDENGKMKEVTEVTLPMAELPFGDVPEGQWYVPDIRYVLQEGLMNGHSSSEFEPEGTLTRAQMTQILYNRAECPEEFVVANHFDDVRKTDWFWKPVMWAAVECYVGGYDNGCFGPDDNITREQLAAILYRYAGEPNTDGTLKDFKDTGDISDFAVVPLQWAVENEIMGGKGDGILDPLGFATRAEAAKMIRCYMEHCEIK